MNTDNNMVITREKKKQEGRVEEEGKGAQMVKDET